MDYENDKKGPEVMEKEKEALKHFVLETVEKMTALSLPVQNEFMRTVGKITIEQRTNRINELDAESGELKKSLDDLISNLANTK
jgi:hypothetical protein